MKMAEIVIQQSAASLWIIVKKSPQTLWVHVNCRLCKWVVKAAEGQ